MASIKALEEQHAGVAIDGEEDNVLSYDVVETEEHMMASLWQPRKGVFVKELDPNLYLFQFYHELDIQRVITGSSWTFNRIHFIFERITPWVDPRSIVLHRLDLWVQVFGLKTGFKSMLVLKDIAKFIGTFVETDPKNFQGLWRDYLRVRVKVDITLFTTPLEEIEKPYGEWMYAQPRRRNNMVGSKWLCIEADGADHQFLGGPDAGRILVPNMVTTPLTELVGDDGGNRGVQGNGQSVELNMEGNSPFTSFSNGKSTINIEEFKNTHEHLIGANPKRKRPNDMCVDERSHVAHEDNASGLVQDDNDSMAQSGSKNGLLDLLRRLANEFTLPWCVMGDLNNTLSHEDKLGENPYPEWLLQGFHKAISDCNLINFDLSGYQYTWERGRGTANWIEVRRRNNAIVKLQGPNGAWFDWENGLSDVPVIEEEVQKALFHMHLDKSLGPDGMTLAFYQKNWGVVGVDVINQHPTTMGDLRPIALCNVLYNVISKVVANCLKGVLSTAISNSQIFYKFVRGGREIGPLIPSRGIRQGDPLLPYLFIICAEGLSSLLHRYEMNGSIRGCKVARGAPVVSHMLFVDDSYVYCKATKQEASNVLSLLRVFEGASSQQVVRRLLPWAFLVID
uniref:DUF4283 domain-containing protein n=1 Tax=Cannabis sativa TaxID=3483 RepID=A0A803PRX9_CANSA